MFNSNPKRRKGPWNGDSRKINLQKLGELEELMTDPEEPSTHGSWEVSRTYTNPDGLFMLLECRAADPDGRPMVLNGREGCAYQLTVLRGEVRGCDGEVLRASATKTYGLEGDVGDYTLSPMTADTAMIIVALTAEGSGEGPCVGSVQQGVAT